MHDRYGELQAQLDATRNLLTSKQTSGEASFNFFRAENAKACTQPIQFSSPSPIADFELKERDFFDDETPLGGALLSLLNELGDQPADIYLFTDGEQSPNCGPDICEVANAYLPRSGIKIKPILISPSRSDSDRLGCIEAAQLREYPSVSLNENVEIVEEQKQAKPTFWERWLWFVSFILVALAGIRLGVVASRKALELANETEDLRSLQTSILLEDNEIAKKKLVELLAGIHARQKELVDREMKQSTTAAAKSGDNKTKTATEAASATDAESTELSRPPKQASAVFVAFSWAPWSLSFGSIAILALVALALIDGSCELFGFSFGRAQAATWDVLDSDFATAFAGTWIAIVFFTFSQIQRLLECQHQHYIATNEAVRVESAKKSEELKAAQAALLKAKEAVANIAIRDPWPKTIYSKAFVVTDTDRANFESVKARARELASGELAPKFIADLIAVKAEVQRLKEFSPRLWLFGSSVELSAFVRRLNDQSLITNESERSAFDKVTKAISDKNAFEIKSSLSRLAEIINAK